MYYWATCVQASRVEPIPTNYDSQAAEHQQQQQRVGRRSGIEKPVPRQFGRLRRGVKVVQYNIAINESRVEKPVCW